FGVTSSSFTPNCSTTIFLTRSSIVLMGILSPDGISWCDSECGLPVDTIASWFSATQADCLRSAADCSGTCRQSPARLCCGLAPAPTWCVASGHVHAAIHMQGFASDVTGTRRGQECHRLRNVCRVTQSLQGNLAEQGIALLLGQRTGHVGIDESGGDDIDGDSARTDFAGDRFREGDDAGLGSRVI